MPSTTGKEQLSYTVQLDAALTRIEVELCPSGFRIERLNAPSPGAQRLLEAGRVVTPEGDYACTDEGLDLPATKPDECLRYAVKLPDKSADANGFRRVGQDVLASPDLWLWVPTPRPAAVAIRAHFRLPEGLVAALPWRSAAAGSAGSASDTDYEIPETAFAWKSAGAFTHSTATSLAVSGAELSVVSLGVGFGAHESEVRRWVEQGARSSSLLLGRFPVPQTLVLVVPAGRPGPAFGMALRGGGPAVVILLDRNAGAATLADDWTCTHEFLHLGVPRLPPEDSWLFEGLATYYTEVTRARAGIISPEQAYQHLLDGFERGRKNGGSLTLREESAQMRERHSFFRVYWAGAALALLTDLSARRAGGPTLDQALRSFSNCCAAAEDDWTADRVLAHLDATLGAPRFSDQARRWLDRREFPELGGALRALGVTAGSQGRAVFGHAPDAALRDAIMARAEPPEGSITEPQREQHQSQ